MSIAKTFRFSEAVSFDEGVRVTEALGTVGFVSNVVVLLGR